MRSLTPDQEVKYYGGFAHRPPLATELIAGPLRCHYEDGYLRYIRRGDSEILRMIYSAVRDHNWNTVAPNISNEKIKQSSNRFEITYDCHYQQGDITFFGTYRIYGKEDGSIRFSINGEAGSNFRRNRIGFCVLHPADIAGTDCLIESPSGEQIQGQFPTKISPHQPFKSIHRMKWSPTDDLVASLEFDGDIFETEDQRNWTDDSFKTYCTPLELPFPVTVEKGEKIFQEVILRVEAANSDSNQTQPPLQFSITTDSSILTKIGVSQSTEINTLTSKDIELLQKIKFDHYRVDIRLFEPDWAKAWQLAQQEGQALGWPLEVALHFGNQIAEELVAFIGTDVIAPIDAILIFHQQQKVTSQKLLNHVLPTLREYFPKAKIGSGTDHFFTELNRERLSADHLDFLMYSINPQVHQFDNQSLIETLQAQTYTVESARQFSSQTPIRVSPVTLKMRRNPNATGDAPPADKSLPDSVDTRQLSLFGGGWTVGSLRNLIQAKAASVTFFETIGRKGIMVGNHQVSTPELFPAASETVYPIYLVFQFLLSEKKPVFLETTINDSWQVEGLAFRSKKNISAIVANLQPQAVTVQLPAGIFRSVKILDENNFEEATKQPITFLSSHYHACSDSLNLAPYALAFLRSDHNN